jgi:hypothetical protein
VPRALPDVQEAAEHQALEPGGGEAGEQDRARGAAQGPVIRPAAQRQIEPGQRARQRQGFGRDRRQLAGARRAAAGQHVEPPAEVGEKYGRREAVAVQETAGGGSVLRTLEPQRRQRPQGEDPQLGRGAGEPRDRLRRDLGHPLDRLDPEIPFQRDGRAPRLEPHTARLRSERDQARRQIVPQRPAQQAVHRPAMKEAQPHGRGHTQPDADQIEREKGGMHDRRLRHHRPPFKAVVYAPAEVATP